MLENDLVEAIVALPTDIFFRTNIATYLWILSNKKTENRKGKVQLINATNLWTPIKNEGNKRRIVSDDQRRQILDIYAAAENDELSKMVDYRIFGYRRIKVLRPLRMKLMLDKQGLSNLESSEVWQKLSPEHQSFWLAAIEPHLNEAKKYSWAETFAKETVKDAGAKSMKVKANKTFITALVNAFGQKDPEADPVINAQGEFVPDTDLTDYENVPYLDSIQDYFVREVMPHVPDAYIDESYTDDKDKQLGRVGYEINFNRFFYQY